MKVNTCLQTEPEVGEPVRKGIPSRHVLFGKIARSYDDSISVVVELVDEYRDIICEMLAVGINRDGMGESHLTGFPETSHQRMSLTSVWLTSNDGDEFRKRTEFCRCAVCAAIVDHYHLITIL